MKNTYSEMKDSGVAWIGAIPTIWDTKHLFQLTIQVKNKNSALLEQNLLSLSYGKIKRKSIETTEGLLPASFDNYNIVEKDDIVLRLTDLQNDHTSLRVGKVEEKGIITSAYVSVRPVLGVSKYIYYALHSFDLKKGFYGMGSGVRQGLNFTEAKMIRIPFPELPEQTAVAAYLDEKCGTIDEIIAEAKASIEEYKAWKSSVIFEAVTKGLDPHAEMKDSGVEWIGKVPRHWRMTKTKFCSSKIGSGKTPRGGAEIYTDSGVMILRSQNIYNTGLMLDNVSYISEEIDNEMANSRVFEDDILLNITGGSIGRCCIYPANFPHANVNQHVCIIRVIKDIMIPKLMLYIWMSDIGQKSIDICQTGANREGMNFEQIGNTIIPMMAYTEQQAIVNYLDEKCTAIDGIIAEKEALIADMEAYKKSLIFETVTGKRKVC